MLGPLETNQGPTPEKPMVRGAIPVAVPNLAQGAETPPPLTPIPTWKDQSHNLSPPSPGGDRRRRASSSAGEQSRPSSISPQPTRFKTKPKQTAPSSSAVFAYLECVTSSQPPALPNPDALLPTPALASLFKQRPVLEFFVEVEDYLLKETIIGDRRAYNDCAKKKRDTVHGILKTERQELYRRKLTLQEQKDFEKRVSLFNAADVIFKFFFPPDTWVPTIRKFWGAVLGLVNVSTKYGVLRSRSSSNEARWPGPIPGHPRGPG